jgi:hypothetical protein
VSARASDEFLSQRIDDLRDETRVGLTDVREEMRGGFADVRAELGSLRGRLDTLLLAWVGGLLGVIAALLAIIATLAVKL